MLAWIAGWTVLFSGLDFWTIKLYDICNLPWFQTYRSIMRYGVSWVAPPSFALAENAYFLWVNAFDGERTMHEWDFYTGNPVNPDGDYNFVWGNNSGGWTKFPMKVWYSGWLLPTIPWLALFLLLLERKKAFLAAGLVLARLAALIPPGEFWPSGGA